MKIDLQEWVPRNGRWEVIENGLRHAPQTVDGKPAARARGDILYRLPGRGCGRIEFSANAVSDEVGELVLVVDDWWIGFSHTENHKPFICRFGRALAFGEGIGAKPGATYCLKVRGNEDALFLDVDGVQVLAYKRPRSQPYRYIGFRTWGSATFTNIQLRAEKEIPALPPSAKPAKFLVSAAVDFFDDIMAAPFTAAMVHKMMKRLKELGVGRIYWNAGGNWLPEVRTDPELKAAYKQYSGGSNFYKTVIQGWKWFETAAKAAHDVGMEAYVFMKLFDLSLPPRTAAGTPVCYRKDQRFILKHPEMLLARRPSDGKFAADDTPVSTVRFVKNDARPSALKSEHLRLWVSDDNKSYRPYEGPLQRKEAVERRVFRDWWTDKLEPERDVRVLSLEGLDIRTKYFAVSCNLAECGKESFRNQLDRLTEMLAADGKPVVFSYGVKVERRVQSIHGPQSAPDARTFENAGFVMDRPAAGVPTGALSGADAIEYLHALDNREGVIGFQRGRTPQPINALCPAYPEVRQLWLDWIRDMLDEGADGIDLRIRNHNNVFDWAEFGFNPPVLEDFRKRYGHGITRSLEDRLKHQRLMTEYYEVFLRDAGALVRGRGKKLQAHVSIPMDVQPSERSMIGMYWDWRKWISAGMVDAITLKEVFPGTNFFDEAADFAKKHRVPAHFCPYLNTLLTFSPSWKDTVGYHLRSARAEGLDGMILYEVACFTRGTDGEDVAVTHPQIAELIKEAQTGC